MDRITQIIRLATTLVLACIVAVAYTTVKATPVVGQTETCIEGIETCVSLAHEYKGSCEGDVCYTEWEHCCLEGISN